MTEKKNTWSIDDYDFHATEQGDGSWMMSFHENEFTEGGPFVSMSLKRHPTREGVLEEIIEFMEGSYIEGTLHVQEGVAR